MCRLRGFPVTAPGDRGDRCLLQEVSVCHRTESSVGSPRSGVRSAGDLAGSAASGSQLEPLRPWVWAGPRAGAEVNVFLGVPVQRVPGRGRGSRDGDTSVQYHPFSFLSPQTPKSPHVLGCLCGFCVFHVFMLKNRTEQLLLHAVRSTC